MPCASFSVERSPRCSFARLLTGISNMKYLHTMVRVENLEASLAFYVNALGLRELRRTENEKGRFTLVFLAAPGDDSAQVELTYNWDPETLTGGRNFGHLAYRVDNIYETCQRLMDAGVRDQSSARAMVTWPSCARRTTSRSSCCKPAARCRPQSLGCRCPTPASGKPLSRAARRPRADSEPTFSSRVGPRAQPSAPCPRCAWSRPCRTFSRSGP